MVSQRKRHFYQCTKAQSLTSEGMTEPFHILQDDTLTQCLFIIVVDYCKKLRMDKYPDTVLTIMPWHLSARINVSESEKLELGLPVISSKRSGSLI